MGDFKYYLYIGEDWARLSTKLDGSAPCGVFCFNYENLAKSDIDEIREKIAPRHLIVDDDISAKLAVQQKPFSPNSNRLKYELKAIGKKEYDKREVMPGQDIVAHKFNQNLESAKEKEKEKQSQIKRAKEILKEARNVELKKCEKILRAAKDCIDEWFPNTSMNMLVKICKDTLEENKDKLDEDFKITDLELCKLVCRIWNKPFLVG